jgi:PAS domain S-box-containing protein
MRILLVDDDSGNRAILRTVLEGHGYGVAEAADGTEALRVLETENFAAVITDILMPKMDGYRLCHEIRHHPRLRHLPIIIYTATYTAPSDERLSLDFGANRFLHKPAATDELIRAVREVLAESSRGAPPVRTGLDCLGEMQQYSQGLVDKLAQKNLELEGQASALRLSERWSRLVFDAANDATFLVKLDSNGYPGRIIDANEAASELLGYTQEELLARTVLELEPAGDEASIGEMAARLQAQQRLVFERRLVAKSGRQIPVELSVRSLPSELGPIAIAAARDITDRKKAEAERSEHEHRLRAILDNLFAFVGLLSLDGTVLEVNRAPLEAAGIRREDVIGKPFHETFWWSYSAETQAQLKGALARAAQGETVRFDVVVRVAGGSELPVDFAVNPLRDETGAVRMLVASGVDITERKKLEKQFLRAQRMEAIGTLASGIAHDLNNILAPMLMAASLIKAKLTAPRDQEVAGIIETSAQRGAAVIRQLLTFSRGSEGPRGAVQVRHLINDMVHLAQETFPRDIEVESNAPADLWSVEADATQLHQVLMNLCVNARDAMPKGGKLSVSADNVQLTEETARLNPLVKPPTCGRHRGGYGRGNPEGNSRPHLRSVFHDQTGGPRHRFGSFHGAGDRPQSRRLRHRLQRAGSRDRLQGLSSGGRASGRRDDRYPACGSAGQWRAIAARRRRGAHPASHPACAGGVWLPSPLRQERRGRRPPVRAASGNGATRHHRHDDARDGRTRHDPLPADRGRQHPDHRHQRPRRDQSARRTLRTRSDRRLAQTL